MIDQQFGGSIQGMTIPIDRDFLAFQNTGNFAPVRRRIIHLEVLVLEDVVGRGKRRFLRFRRDRCFETVFLRCLAS